MPTVDPRDAELAAHRADDFNGDDAHLISCIDALLDLDDAKALVPHGLGGRGSHAYRLLCAARHRLARPEPLAGSGVAGERDSTARAILDGWSEGSETWDEASEMTRLRCYFAADAVLALRTHPAPEQSAHCSGEVVEVVAEDVVRLVIAARRACEIDSWVGRDEDRRARICELDNAAEAFASRVPWENEHDV